jgi:hypothetical protein
MLYVERFYYSYFEKNLKIGALFFFWYGMLSNFITVMSKKFKNWNLFYIVCWEILLELCQKNLKIGTFFILYVEKFYYSYCQKKFKNSSLILILVIE